MIPKSIAASRPSGKREQIALVEVGVEEAVDHRLAEEGADQDRGERLEVVAGGDQRVAVGQLDAVDPFERQHPPRGAASSRSRGRRSRSRRPYSRAARRPRRPRAAGRARAWSIAGKWRRPAAAAAAPPRRPSPRPARRPIHRSRSRAAKSSSISGRSTLTATCRPSVVTARWTWAIEAAPTGSGSTSEKSSSSGWLERPARSPP